MERVPSKNSSDVESPDVQHNSSLAVVGRRRGWLGQPGPAGHHQLPARGKRVLKEQLGGKRLQLTDDQRRRLAAKGKLLGRRILADFASIVSPDTILARHRRLIAKKWDYSSNRRGLGRPAVMREIAELVIRMARENPSWGYGRIQGALANLGHRVARTTVANIIKEHGIDPAPRRRRGMSWTTFLKAHWHTESHRPVRRFRCR
jgi:hypothetical protein